MNDDLRALWAGIWDGLVSGVAQGDHPFHLGVLATSTPDGVRQRTVVLRAADADAWRLRCHTDARAAKVAEIAADPRVGWLFYDADRRVQLRVDGRAVVRTAGDDVDDAWRTTPLLSRRAYLGDAPADPRADPATGLPHPLTTREPTEAESEQGRERFAIVDVRVEAIDWLSIRFSGHLRARFTRDDDGIDATWLTP